MRKLIVGCLLACLFAGSVFAATNTVTVAWKSPLNDAEGNALPADAIARYDVLVGRNAGMSGATVYANVPSAAGTEAYTAPLDLTNGVWYVSVQAVDIIGQKGLLKAPVIHATMVAPGEVRDLEITTVTGTTLSLGISVTPK